MSADQPDYDFIEAQERGYDEAERRREEIDRLRSRIMELEKALASEWMRGWRAGRRHSLDALHLGTFSGLDDPSVALIRARDAVHNMAEPDAARVLTEGRK